LGKKHQLDNPSVSHSFCGTSSESGVGATVGIARLVAPLFSKADTRDDGSTTTSTFPNSSKQVVYSRTKIPATFRVSFNQHLRFIKLLVADNFRDARKTSAFQIQHSSVTLVFQNLGDTGFNPSSAIGSFASIHRWNTSFIQLLADCGPTNTVIERLKDASDYVGLLFIDSYFLLHGIPSEAVWKIFNQGSGLNAFFSEPICLVSCLKEPFDFSGVVGVANGGSGEHRKLRVEIINVFLGEKFSFVPSDHSDSLLHGVVEKFSEEERALPSNAVKGFDQDNFPCLCVLQ
jgi:hypothetical protein